MPINRNYFQLIYIHIFDLVLKFYTSLIENDINFRFTLGSVSPTPRKQNKSFLKVVDQVAASKFFQQVIPLHIKYI